MSTVIRADLWVRRKRICTKQDCFVSLSSTRAAHDVLAKAPLPHLFTLWLCIRMCLAVFQALGWPSPLFSPPGIILRVHTGVHLCVRHCSFSRGALFYNTVCMKKKLTAVCVHQLNVCTACSSLVCVCPEFSLWHFHGLTTRLQVLTCLGLHV